jgi:hypothetical protein
MYHTRYVGLYRQYERHMFRRLCSQYKGLIVAFTQQMIQFGLLSHYDVSQCLLSPGCLSRQCITESTNHSLTISAALLHFILTYSNPSLTGPKIREGGHTWRNTSWICGCFLAMPFILTFSSWCLQTNLTWSRLLYCKDTGSWQNWGRVPELW